MRVLFAVAMLAASGVGAGLIGDDVEANYRSLRLLAAGIAAIILLRYAMDIVRLMQREIWIGVLLVWTILSAAWAEDAFEALTTFLGLASVTITGAALVVRYGVANSARFVMFLYTITSVASILVVKFLPNLGTVVVVHPIEGMKTQAIGVFSWNSDMAFSAAIACVLAAALWAINRSWVLFAAFMINLVSIVMADSVATILSVMGAIVVLLFVRYRVARVIMIFGAVPIVVILLVMGFQGLFGPLIEAMGRSIDLTGRSNIWNAALQQVVQKPFFGWGAGAQPDFLQYLGYGKNHAHNGFIQMLFDRGLVGLVLAVLIFVSPIARAVRGSEAARLALPLVALVFIANLANSYLTFASLGTLMLFWAAFASCAPSLDIDVQRASGWPGSPRAVVPSVDAEGVRTSR